MARYVLTGAPGAGKTSILLALQEAGHAVVAEAATDVVAAALARGQAAPEAGPEFIGNITDLQRARQRTAPDGGLVFFDRSPVCTLALARFLGTPVPVALRAEVDRMISEQTYERRVFFVRLLGFLTPTAVRRISLDGARAFEAAHEDVYRELGFELIDVPVAPLMERVALVLTAVLRPDGVA